MDTRVPLLSRTGQGTSMNRSMLMLQDNKLFDFMIIFHNEADQGPLPGKTEEQMKFDRIKIVHALKQAELNVRKFKSRDGDELMVLVGASQDRLEEEAEDMDMRVRLKEEYGGGWTEFRVAKRSLFRSSRPWHTSFQFLSAVRQKLITSIIETPKSHGGAGIDLQDCRKRGVFKDMLFLHTPTRKKLLKNWALAWKKPQPIDQIKQYFGEKIALYFAWLGVYTYYLMFPAGLGLILFIVQLATQTDNPGVPAFACFMAMWSTAFLEQWKRRNAVLVARWGVEDFEETQKPRPQFEGVMRKSPIDGKPELFYPPKERRKKYPFSFFVVFVSIMLVVATLLALIVYKHWMLNHFPGIGGVIGGVTNGIVIVILNTVYTKVNTQLTEWENHRTETAYEDMLIAKSFLFQFANSYITLYYIAFFKPYSAHWDLHSEYACKGSCIAELSSSLASIFIIQLVIGNAQEVIVPRIMQRLKIEKEVRALKKSGRNTHLTTYENQAKLAEYEGVFGEYNEMILQFGYVNFFAAAFPLAPLAALANNVVELRSDAYKLLTAYRRPESWCAEDMGTWYYLLELMSVIGIITNVGLVTFTSHEFDHLSTSSRVYLFFIAEHVLIIIKIVLAAIIPDVPESVDEEIRRQNYQRDVALGDVYDKLVIDRTTELGPHDDDVYGTAEEAGCALFDDDEDEEKTA